MSGHVKIRSHSYKDGLVRHVDVACDKEEVRKWTTHNMRRLRQPSRQL